MRVVSALARWIPSLTASALSFLSLEVLSDVRLLTPFRNPRNMSRFTRLKGELELTGLLLSTLWSRQKKKEEEVV